MRLGLPFIAAHPIADALRARVRGDLAHGHVEMFQGSPRALVNTFGESLGGMLVPLSALRLRQDIRGPARRAPVDLLRQAVTGWLA